MIDTGDEKLNKVIEGCRWRQDVAGTDVCKGMCLPCVHVIEQGKCDALKKYFGGKK